MSKPPEPRPRSAASTFTTTSSPASTGPTIPSSAHAARRSPSTSTVSGSVWTTVPLRSFSIATRQLDDGLAYGQHLDDAPGRDALLGRVIGLGAVRQQHALEAARDQRVRVAA